MVVVAADLVVVAMFFLFVGVVVLLAAEPALGAWILVHNLNIRHQRNATGSKIQLAWRRRLRPTSMPALLLH